MARLKKQAYERKKLNEKVQADNKRKDYEGKIQDAEKQILADMKSS